MFNKKKKAEKPKTKTVGEVWIQPYTQQGDCLIKKVGSEFADIFEVSFDEIPKDAKKTNNPLLLKGLSNNHAIVKGEADYFEKDGRVFFMPKTPLVLDHVKDMRSKQHAQHHALTIPLWHKGYFVDAVNEFDHGKEENRKVID